MRAKNDIRRDRWSRIDSTESVSCRSNECISSLLFFCVRKERNEGINLNLQ